MTYPGQPMTRPTLAGPAGGSSGPSARHLIGRSILVIVHTYDPNNIYPGDTKTNPQVTCDLYVLDGGPVAYGGSAKPGQAPTPETHQCQTPAFFPGVQLNGNGVAKGMGAYAGTSRPVGGRIIHGEKAMLFVELGKPGVDPRAAEAPVITETLLDLLMAHRGAGSAGKPAGSVNPFGEVWTPPTPVELNPTAPPNGAGAYPGYPTAPQVSYGPPSTPALPAVPQLPTMPVLPPPPAPAPLPRPAAFSSDAQWTQAWPLLSDSDRAAWAAQPRAV